MKEIRIGIIGLGYWGPNILRNLLRLPNVGIIGCDIDNKIAKKISLEFPSIEVTTDTNSLFSDKGIDAIIVATPPQTHYILAKNALSSGKHVLIEKPMTTSSNDAKKLYSIANKSNRILMVGHTFAYAEPIKMIKSLIVKNKLGKIYYFDSSRINLGLIQEKTNVIWDLACHDVAILDFLFTEKPIMVSAFASSHIAKKQHEIAHIFLTYPSGMIAHITTSWISPVKLRTIHIAGNKKMITYDDIEPTEKLKIYDRGIAIKKSDITPFRPAYRSGNVLIPTVLQKEALFNELSHFLTCIKQKKNPLTDGACGIRVVKILEAIDKAILSQKTVRLSWS